jgi:hypothetical protein
MAGTLTLRSARLCCLATGVRRWRISTRTGRVQPQLSCCRGRWEHGHYSGVLHTASEIGQDVPLCRVHGKRVLRTTSLRASWQRPPFFHDGTGATIDDGVTPYNNFRRLRFSVAQQRDLIQYLKSLVPRLVAKIFWMRVTSAGETVAWELKRRQRSSIRVGTMK